MCREVVCATRHKEFERFCLPKKFNFEVGRDSTPAGGDVLPRGDFRCREVICAARRKEFERLCLPPKRHFEVRHDPARTDGGALARGDFRRRTKGV